MIRSYTQAAEKLTGRNAQSRKIANNTYLIRRDENTIAIKLHATDIVIYHADGRIEFQTGGWKTVTTKARMNEFAPVQIWQARGVWTVKHNGTEAIFADGLTLNPDGTFTGEGEDEKAVQKQVAKIRKFTKAYMAAFDAGNVPAPSGGDCWYCALFGKNATDTEHLVSHIEESYFVPSLLTLAIDRFPVSIAAKAYISDKWAGTNNGGYFAEIGREQIGKSLYRYMKQQFGIAA